MCTNLRIAVTENSLSLGFLKTTAERKYQWAAEKILRRIISPRKRHSSFVSSV